MNKASDKKYKKMKRFSWIEFFVFFLGSFIFASLPGILYGADLSMIWSVYTFWYSIYWIIISAILYIVTSYMKRRKFERPLRKMSEAANKVANGDFSVYLESEHTLDKIDYIDAMFVDFNKMVAELGSIETLKSDFVSNISHEIKTPLAVIKNYTTAMKREVLPPETREEYMDIIIDAADKLAELITNILRLNKLEHQEIDPQPKPYDLCRQLCDCALRFEALWEQKNIEFIAEIEDKAIITADESMLEIVWNNLLSNALKFTDPGGRITLSQTSDEHSIIVSVSDTGCGMDEETMKRIFDKFYQGKTVHKSEGNGLGLALVQKVIDRVGGTLTVKSKQGKGTVFNVRLDIDRVLQSADHWYAEGLDQY